MSKVTLMQIAMVEAGAIWDDECKEAFDMGLFDTTREQFIAERLVAFVGSHREYAPPVTRDMIQTALEQIHEYVTDYGEEYGMPIYYPDAYDYISNTLIDALQLQLET